MLVFAAGNSGKKVGSPADFPEIFAIGAVNNNDGKASFSSIGPASWDGVDYIKPEVMAPGVSVISYYGEKLAGIDGTSMASPNATGVIALLLEADPSLSIAKIKSVLKETALDLGTAGPDNQYGHGRIDAYAALAKVTGKNTFKSMIYQYDSYRNAIMERSRTLDGKYDSEMAYIQLVTRKDELKESIVEYMNNNNVYQIMSELAEENIDISELF